MGSRQLRQAFTILFTTHYQLSIIHYQLSMISRWHRFFIFLNYAYLLRFPLLTAIFLIVFPYVAIGTGAAPLLENLFDLESTGILFVTLTAFLAAWSVMVTSRLVLLYCHKRFRVPRTNISIHLHRRDIFLFGLLALPALIGIYWEIAANWQYTPPRERWLSIFAPLPGFLSALLLLRIAGWLQKRLNRPATNDQAPDLLTPSNPLMLKRALARAEKAEPIFAPPGRLAGLFKSIPRYFGRGYIDYRADASGRFPLLPGHGMAVAMLITFLAVYAIVGALASPWWRRFDVPSLAYALLLVTLLNWALSGIAYFFDRYYVPVLVLIFLLLGTSSLVSSRSDSYYLVHSKNPGQNVEDLPPERVIRPLNNGKIILVAASGGGIQSAAWTARVLTGLELACRNSPDCGGRSFGRSIRLISAVSGGSVGTMYFANAYGSDGDLPSDIDGLNEVVRLAERSSLDGVAWGMIYPDFLRTAFPFFSQLSFFGMKDRGTALEFEWQRGTRLNVMLSDWRRDVGEGKRPATVFNATLAELGQPLLFSTVDHVRRQTTSRSFHSIYDGYDVPVATAVRLSSTFPYITPAARAYFIDQGDVREPQYHVVDGGYYDNYGIATLVEWLDAALEKCGREVKEVMVIRIHGAPVDGEREPDGNRGFLYQMTVPISTLNSVRGAGQLSHSRVELDLLKRSWGDKGISIESATFEFPRSDDPNEAPPLSWHLSEKQKRAIEKAWQVEYVDNPQSQIGKVKQFLAR
jgi:Patatin-like phospholipase